MIFNPDMDAQLLVDDWNSKVKSYHLSLYPNYLEIDGVHVMSEHNVEYPDITELNLPLHICRYEWLRLTPKLYNNLSTNIISRNPVGVDIYKDSKGLRVQAPIIQTNIAALSEETILDTPTVKIHADFVSDNQKGRLKRLILRNTKYMYLYPAFEFEAKTLCYSVDPNEWLPVYDKNLKYVVIEWEGRQYVRRVKGVPRAPFNTDGMIGCSAFAPQYKKETC